MKAVYIPRTLFVGENSFTEEQLLLEGRVFVVLAEPGAGKTELLKTLAQMLGTTRVRASFFRNSPPTSVPTALVVDAMDEVARIDIAATNAIIQKAALASAPTVVFAGRSAEWDEGRTVFVEQCFGIRPIVVRIEPFTETEQRRLFAAKFPGEEFEGFADSVQRFELGPLLGNPQFLELLGAAYLESGRVFTSKAKIFADAVSRLAHEANSELGRQPERPPSSEIVTLGGEVFAKILLSGSAGISTVERLDDRDFPYINSLCRQTSLSSFLIDTRLLKPSEDADTHEPIHRIVAEYCAASYLVGRIEDSKDRLSLQRVLAVIAPNGVTRDELRGMLGWMAALGREPLQTDAIQLDPYAILANGDPSQLTSAAKRQLLTELERLAEVDPMFRRSDVWRRFNVGHFFTADIFDHVRTILSKEGALRNLLLELLVASEAASGLVPELRALMNNPGTEGYCRKLAMQVLLSASAYDPVSDFSVLLAERTPVSLEMASRLITARGVSVVGVQAVSVLLQKLGDLYPDSRSRDRNGVSRYFIDVLVRSFEIDHVVAFLDSLSALLVCKCSAAHEYECACRTGASKVIAKLLDRYFELAHEGHDSNRIWSWMKNLHFQTSRGSDGSPAVKKLSEDNDLRRSIQQLSVKKAATRDEIHGAVVRFHFGHAHSGLLMRNGDREALSRFAFDSGLVDLWAELLAWHNLYTEDNERSSSVRTLQRQQAKTSLEFLAVWARSERQSRRRILQERQAGRRRSRKRYERQEAAIKEADRAKLRANLSAVESGRHWGWLKWFAQCYLLESDKLNDIVEDPETPLRALRTCFPMIQPHLPSVEMLGRGEKRGIAEVLLAACLVRYRDGESLEYVDPQILAAVKTEASGYPAFVDGEEEAFNVALDSVLFRAAGSAESFARDYFEGQLASGQEGHVRVHWLDDKPAFRHLLAALPLEWLDRFPRMSLDATRSLFEMAAKHGNPTELQALIDRRVAELSRGSDSDDGTDSEERRKFWQLNAFFHQSASREAAWEELKTDPKIIFALEHRLGRLHYHRDDHRPPITAEHVFRILDAYVDLWPKVPLPSSYGSDDPENERAYRFLTECIWKIAEDAPARRLIQLDKLIADQRFAQFRSASLSLRAEANRQMALEDFRAPHPSAINALLDEGEVASVEDLRALMVEELGEFQKWLVGSETDPLVTFYPGGNRVDENTARNRIVDRLQSRMTALGLSVIVERHMSGGNRCDITASADVDGKQALLVVEVKGQWNRELYLAASEQLEKRYAIHPDAAGQGIYLVLWFGNGEKVAGLSEASITTAAELRNRVVSSMPEEIRSRIDVVVLDLSSWPALSKGKVQKGASKHSPKPKPKPKPKTKASS